MWLMDAYNAMVNTVDPFFEHSQLLVIQRVDNKKVFVLVAV